MKLFITFYLGKKSLLLQYKIITCFIKKFFLWGNGIRYDPVQN